MLQFEEQKARLTAVTDDIKELGDALGLEYLKREIESLEVRSSAPGFWDNLEKAQEIQQNLSRLKLKVEKYEKAISQQDEQNFYSKLNPSYRI